MLPLNITFSDAVPSAVPFAWCLYNANFGSAIVFCCLARALSRRPIFLSHLTRSAGSHHHPPSSSGRKESLRKMKRGITPTSPYHSETVYDPSLLPQTTTSSWYSPVHRIVKVFKKLFAPSRRLARPVKRNSTHALRMRRLEQRHA